MAGAEKVLTREQRAASECDGFLAVAGLAEEAWLERLLGRVEMWRGGVG
jgi:hypothetical protein